MPAIALFASFHESAQVAPQMGQVDLLAQLFWLGGEWEPAAAVLPGSRLVVDSQKLETSTMKYALPALAASALVVPGAAASPFVYTTGGLLSSDLKTCMAQAKNAATKSGFTQDQEEVLDEDKKDAVFFASKPDSPLSLAVRCFPTAGVFSIAVSGINNDASYDQFKKFADIFYEN